MSFYLKFKGNILELKFSTTLKVVSLTHVTPNICDALRDLVPFVQFKK